LGTRCVYVIWENNCCRHWRLNCFRSEPKGTHSLTYPYNRKWWDCEKVRSFFKEKKAQKIISFTKVSLVHHPHPKPKKLCLHGHVYWPPVDQNISLHILESRVTSPESRVCHCHSVADVSPFALAINHYYQEQHFNDFGHLHTHTPVYKKGAGKGRGWAGSAQRVKL